MSKVDAAKRKAQGIRNTMQGISEILPYLCISGAAPAQETAILPPNLPSCYNNQLILNFQDHAGLKDMGITHVTLSDPNPNY